MTSPNPEECRHVEKYVCHFSVTARDSSILLVRIPDHMLLDPVHGFAAADMGMLVPADQERKAALFERVKCHRSCVVVAGEGIACRM